MHDQELMTFEEAMIEKHHPHDAFSRVGLMILAFILLLFKIIYKKHLKYFNLDTLTRLPADLITSYFRSSHPDAVLSCEMQNLSEGTRAFLWEYKAHDDPDTICQLLNHATAFISCHFDKIKKGEMLLPNLTLIMQGTRKKLKTFKNYITVKDPTGLFDSIKIKVTIFWISKVSDKDIKEGWPWTFPIFVMKYWEHPKLARLMAEKIADLLRHHNANGFFNKHIGNAMMYIFLVRGIEMVQEINAIVNSITGGMYMEFTDEVKDRATTYYDRLQADMLESNQKNRQEGRQEGIKEGEQKTMQKVLVECIDTRFPDAPKSLGTRIRRIHEPEYLHALLKDALTSASLATFENAVNAMLQRQAQAR
jgi:hypothetical protein